MLALLISLSFSFDSIPSPQLVDEYFYISISASDSSSRSCSLSVEPSFYDLEICEAENNWITFSDGKWEGWVRIPCMADSIKLCCLDCESKESYLSNKITIKKDEVNISQLRQVATSDSIYIYPNPLSIEQDVTHINYLLREDAHVSVMIFDKFGNLVWNTERDESPGTPSVEWDGTDNNGNRVFSGVYIVFIKATSRTAIIARYAGKIAVIK
jgi:hypothetical protein